MAKKSISLTQDRLKELPSYDPDTGAFTWLDRTATDFKREKDRKLWATRFAGKKAGFEDGRKGRKYVRLYLDGKTYMAHVIAWLYMTGQFPDKQIDHRNNKPWDNAWLNLREANQSQNMANRQAYKNNPLGLKGVYSMGNGRYRACIRVNGRRKHLGCFSTADEAQDAYPFLCEGVVSDRHRHLHTVGFLEW